jgi:hypothetical protein
MLGYKAIDNPVEQNKKLEESDDSSLVDKGKYQYFDICSLHQGYGCCLADIIM